MNPTPLSPKPTNPLSPSTPEVPGMDPRTLTALRSLDAAPPAALTPEQVSRAEQILADILADDPSAGLARDIAAGRPARGQRSRARWVALIAAAAAVALAYTVVPGSPATRDAAFATWTAVPERIPLDAAGKAASYCLEHGAEHTDQATEDAARGSTVAFAERRGLWTFVMLTGVDGFQVTCLSDSSFEDGMIGSAGPVPGTTVFRPPGPREIVLGNCCGGGGTITDGVENLIGEVEGYAGSQVAEIVVHTAAKGPVEATIGKGQFAAWWPDNDSDTRSRGPMTFDLTFTDGTTSMVTLAPTP